MGGPTGLGTGSGEQGAESGSLPLPSSPLPHEAELARRIKAHAYALGFDLCGITSLDAPASGAAFTRWVSAGHAGEMQWLERGARKRLEPGTVAPPAHTAIVVAMNYGGTQSSGPIARYARGQDYHDVIRDRLQLLLDRVREEGGRDTTGRAYVDTGPLLERDLARAAGLGWFGKNTNLLHPGLGSFFFLGALLVNAGVARDESFGPDRCGSCTRCLDACPTGAFVGPRELDARRCISYLTIELRGDVPSPLRPLMGDLVFGCDICQDVCPWNVKFSRPATEPALQGRPGTSDPDLVEILLLTEEGFRERFRGSAVKRAKRRGLARNAAIAMGNRRDVAHIPALARALREDAEPLVRGHAAWGLGCFAGNLAALVALDDARLSEADEKVLREIDAARNKLVRREEKGGLD